MIDRYLPFTSASPEQSSTNMGPAVIDISEITQEEQHPYREVEADPLCMTRLNIPKNPPMLLLPTTLNKREKLDDIARRIPISVLRPYFNYRLRKAAEVYSKRCVNIMSSSLKILGSLSFILTIAFSILLDHISVYLHCYEKELIKEYVWYQHILIRSSIRACTLVSD